MWWWKVVPGVGLVVFAVSEMFQDLFHPTRSGALSEWIGRTLFRAFRRFPSRLASAGPISVVLVIFTWALLLITGFALIYWAVFPADFELQTANQPTGATGFWWCFYYSLQMLTTLGLGDIRPVPIWLRVLSGFHTLLGFSVVTASITWVLLLFPALRRIRTLARKAQGLAGAEQATGVSVASPGAYLLLAGLAEEVTGTRIDLVLFPILFYFYSEDPCASIAQSVGPLMRFAAQGCDPARDDLVRLAAHALKEALQALADHVGDRLNLDDRSPDRAFAELAKLHLKTYLPTGMPAPG